MCFPCRPIALLLLAKDDTSTAVVAIAFKALLSCELHSLMAIAMKDVGCVGAGLGLRIWVHVPDLVPLCSSFLDPT